MDRNQRADLASQVRELRKAKGWSQRRLAEESGVSERSIQSMELGETLPQEGKLIALLDALDAGPASTPTPSDDLPQDVRVFLMVLSQFLTARSPEERLRFMDRITREIVSGA